MGTKLSLFSYNRYEKLPTPNVYRLYTDEIVPIPDEFLEIFAKRLNIKKEELNGMINRSDHDIVIDGEENIDEDFVIQHPFPILPIMYDFEARDAILFIGTEFYAINSKQEIMRLRIIQPPGISEARIERHFKRKLNFKEEVELKAWRNASIILPDVKRKDTLDDLNIDILVGEGFRASDQYYKIYMEEFSGCCGGIEKVSAYKDEKLAINQFRGRTESYFQVKPFKKVPKTINMKDTLIIFRSRKPYKDWILPDGNYMPTVGYPYASEHHWWHVHYGPCTLFLDRVCGEAYVSPANIMFLKSGMLAQYWGDFTRDKNIHSEVENYLSHFL